MKLRAIIFDIYKTLLDVGPPPSDAAERWETLWTKTFVGTKRLSLEKFDAECKQVIAREHAAARATGIAYPEIYWPNVTKAVLPEMAKLSERAGDDFLYAHAQLQRTLSLMTGAKEVLTNLAESDLLLGVASNSQPYTWRELEDAFSNTPLDRMVFKPDLIFMSFENGFSKPDPHVFRLLTARLQNLGIAANEALMIGDRFDNDIAPARAAGWQTWHLNGPSADDAGDWSKLAARLSKEK